MKKKKIEVYKILRRIGKEEDGKYELVTYVESEEFAKAVCSDGKKLYYLRFTKEISVR